MVARSSAPANGSSRYCATVIREKRLGTVSSSFAQQTCCPVADSGGAPPPPPQTPKACRKLLPETFFFASGRENIVNIKSNLRTVVIMLGFPDNVLSMEGAPHPHPHPHPPPLNKILDPPLTVLDSFTSNYSLHWMAVGTSQWRYGRGPTDGATYHVTVEGGATIRTFIVMQLL